MANNMEIDFTRRNKKPRLLTDQEREQLDEFIDSIHYSSRYAELCSHGPLLRQMRGVEANAQARQIQRRPLRVSSCPTTQTDAEEDPERLL
jgi:hypothetical protein